jgi:uncharacterized membrane protein YphA (DoxX/SURF4 family)
MMNIVHIAEVQKRGNRRPADAVELGIRIIAGLFLILDGMHILTHITQLEDLLKSVMSVPKAAFLVYYIGVIHLLGGVFVILGLLTRLIILLQVPAILAEMYYINAPGSFLGSWEIVASSIILILLVIIFSTGSGKFSMDYYRKRNKL